MDMPGSLAPSAGASHQWASVIFSSSAARSSVRAWTSSFWKAWRRWVSHGREGDVELGGDLPVGAPAGGQLGDAPLARRQRVGARAHGAPRSRAGRAQLRARALGQRRRAAAVRELHPPLERLARGAALGARDGARRPARRASGQARAARRRRPARPPTPRAPATSTGSATRAVPRSAMPSTSRPPQRRAAASSSAASRRRVLALAARREQPSGGRAPRRHRPLQAPARQAAAELEQPGDRFLVAVLGLGHVRPREQPDVVEHPLRHGPRRVATRQRADASSTRPASTSTMASSAPAVRS